MDSVDLHTSEGGKLQAGGVACIRQAQSMRNPRTLSLSLSLSLVPSLFLSLSLSLSPPLSLSLSPQGELKGQTKWDKPSRIRTFSQIFADFRLSWELQHFAGADLRRKPQETADFRRKPQETADFRRNPFVPFSLSLLIPPYLPLPLSLSLCSLSLFPLSLSLSLPLSLLLSLSLRRCINREMQTVN